MADRIQWRRDTKARWTQFNPILLEGEVGYELDTDQYKVGNGVNNWNNLPYRGGDVLQEAGNSKTTGISQQGASILSRQATQIAQGATITYTIPATPTTRTMLNFPLVLGMRYEFIIKTKDGTDAPFNVSLHNENGDIIGNLTPWTGTAIVGSTLKFTCGAQQVCSYCSVYFGQTSNATEADVVVSTKFADTVSWDSKNPIRVDFASSLIRDAASNWGDEITIHSLKTLTAVSNIQVPLFLKGGNSYSLKVVRSDEGGNLTFNVQGVHSDGTTEVLASGSGNWISMNPVQDCIHFFIYVGSATVTPVAIDVTVRWNNNRVYTDTPEAVGQANNLYPDSYFDLGKDIKLLEEVLRTDVIGAPYFEDNKLKIPAGSFYGIVFYAALLGFKTGNEQQGGEMFCALCKTNIKEVGGTPNIAIQSDNTAANQFLYSVSLTDDVNYEGYRSIYGRRLALSLSTPEIMRIAFDNRRGTSELVIENFFFYKGDSNTKPFGMFDKIINKLWIDSKIRKNELYINYAPYYNSWNQRYALSSSTIQKDYVHLLMNSSNIHFGFDFQVNDSPFEPGGKLYWGVDSAYSDNDFIVLAIFYNAANAEIKRNQLTYAANDMDLKIRTYASDIPENCVRIWLRFQVTNLTSPTPFIDAKRFIISTSPITIEGDSELRLPIFSSSTESERTFCYVKPLSGNDDNDGSTVAQSVKTISRAQDIIGDEGEIIIVESGDFRETVNVSKKSTQRKLKIKALSGILARICSGTFITDATVLEDNVYQYPLDTFNNLTKFQLFQHDIDDVQTLIPDEERHPLQKGKKYRCNSTMIERTTSLDLVKTSTSKNPKFYYDDTAKILYFRIVDGTNIADNPVVIPSSTGIYGAKNQVALTLENIEVLYGPVAFRQAPAARAVDVACKYAYGAGCFTYDNSVAVEFIRCEATRSFSGSGTGDGFNGHSSTTEPALAKHTTATFINCWAHDCNDDGYSNHERCESTFIGGLFEYCGKGGLTPAFGAHDTYIGCLCRKSNYGIGLVGGATAAEGGVGSQVIAYNCLCTDNNQNYYASGDSSSETTGPNIMELVGCHSLRGKMNGYNAGSYGKLRLRNCYDKDSAHIKTGDVTFENGTLVE